VTLFDPDRGRVVVPAPGTGPGNWSGAPGAWREGGDLYVAYRVRKPHPDRGFELRIAASSGGRFETIWRARKAELASESIERSALVRTGGRWRLYVGLVNASDRRWRIELLESSAADAFDASIRREVLTSQSAGVAAVKDPWLRRVGAHWLMFVSYGPLPETRGGPLHVTGDALSTGRTRSHTGLATSTDGLTWTWEGDVLSPSDSGWDSYTARLCTAVRDEEGWLGLYDGSASLEENYEERCGVARSDDLRHWRRVSVAGPAIGTARGPGGVRYVDVTAAGDVFYEYTREDGSHELRMATV